MNRFKEIFQSEIIHLIQFSAVLACLLLLPAQTSAAGSAVYASDVAPPKITVVAPLKDSRVDTATPRFEVVFSDILSGINTDTVHLFVDRMELTAGAVIEQEDVTGQDRSSPWHLTYTPTAALPKGKHEARFSVEDKAGNLAQLAWSFEVTVGGGGISLSGDNTLRVDKSPTQTTADTLNLTAQGQCLETDIRLNVTGEITDYPGNNPAYYYDGYNFYDNDYSLGFYYRQCSAVFGYVNASLDSELLQIGLKMYGNGGVVSDTQSVAGGQYNWTAFSGDTGISYGTKSYVYHMSGAGGDWKADSGLTLGGYYVCLDGSQTYDFTGFKGNTVINGLGLLRFEVIHGASETVNTSGNGWALHWDKSLAGCDLGLDYTESQPEYPIIGSSAQFTSTGGGLRSYEIRASTSINEHHSLNLDGYISWNNLDHSQAATETHQNISAGYNYRPSTDFSFNVNYQCDIKEEAGEQDQVLILGTQKNIGVSQLKLTCTLDTDRAPSPSKTYNQVTLLNSWTCPVGAYNLTPSLQWNDKKNENGYYSRGAEARLTLDRKFYSDLSRSSIALFYSVSDELGKSGQTKETDIGILPAIYLKTGPSSTLTLVYDWDEDGVNTTINLTWKVIF